MRMPSGKVTIVDIARHAGVSKSTVSLVLQGSARVKPNTRRRVREAITALGYVYNRGAANLRLARSTIVGMVINDLSNPFYAELAVGIERGLQGAGFIPLIANTAETPARQAQVLQSMQEQRVVGLIISPARGTSPQTLSDLAGGDLPVVLVARPVPGLDLTLVVPDNRRGAQMATEHLIALGHRRIAFLGGGRDLAVQEDRAGGYRDALTAAGLSLGDTLVIDSPTNRDGGRSALEAVLRLADPPTAAVCFNDVVAFGACSALKARGMEPGNDFAVIGFDDVADARDMMPSLTTVSVDIQGMGERAAHALLRMIAEGRRRLPDHIGAVELTVRESCGAHRRPAEAGRVPA